MANQWFRMYSEFATDAKVQMMTEVMQRRYLMLMCLRCSNALVTLHDEEIAFQLRIGNEELAETKALFIKKGFIDSAWNLLNWEKRQFASDSSAARVAKHRALQKEKQDQGGNGDVTLQKQKANALDTDTDTDTEEKKKQRVRAAATTSIDGVPQNMLADFIAVRKAKRAGPLTDTAIAGLKREAAKAGLTVEQAVRACIEFGWQGFNAGWYADRSKKTPAKDAVFDACPQWCADAGFEHIAEAENARCHIGNYREFSHGKRVANGVTA